jgi:hypothetical protein
MQFLNDLRSTYAAAKLHWLAVRERNARDWCVDCKFNGTEDCPFDYIKKNTFTVIKVCERFEDGV